MDLVLSQIDRALDRGFHYLAVVSALTLPDICGALESPDGRSTPDKYQAWADKWFLPSYPELTSFDLYRLRCGVVHQGRLGPHGMQYDRVVFTIHKSWHRNISADNSGQHESALQLSATTFCRDMNASARTWFKAMGNDQNVQAHLPHLLSFRPNGISPHFVGIPVIA